MATCPECDIEIEIDEDDIEELDVGDPWVCEGCASNLRFASLDPLELEVDEEEEGDDDKVDGDDGDSDDGDDDDDDDVDWND